MQYKATPIIVNDESAVATLTGKTSSKTTVNALATSVGLGLAKQQLFVGLSNGVVKSYDLVAAGDKYWFVVA